MRSLLSRSLVGSPRYQKTGFTLIEMLVAVAIGLLVTTLGIAGYLDFNERQKVLNSAKELETLFQTAQSKARGGELAGCTQLAAYRLTLNTAVDPVEVTITPVCSDGSFGTVPAPYVLNPGVTVTTSPATTSMDFPSLNGGVSFSSGAPDVTFTLASGSITQQYQFVLARGGDMSEGSWL